MLWDSLASSATGVEVCCGYASRWKNFSPPCTGERLVYSRFLGEKVVDTDLARCEKLKYWEIKCQARKAFVACSNHTSALDIRWYLARKQQTISLKGGAGRSRIYLSEDLFWGMRQARHMEGRLKVHIHHVLNDRRAGFSICLSFDSP